MKKTTTIKVTFLILHHFPVAVLPVVPYALCPLCFAVSCLPNAPLVDPRDSPARIRKKNVKMKNTMSLQQSAFCEQNLLDNDDHGFWYFDAWSVRFASAQSASM